jgi:hypothetical protein
VRSLISCAVVMLLAGALWMGGGSGKAAPAPAPYLEQPTSRPTEGVDPADCVGSCSAVPDGHPSLTSERFSKLVGAFAGEPRTADSPALEDLLFHHVAARRLLGERGAKPLDFARESLLRRELARTHALLEVRVRDREGKLRLTLKPTRVELGVKQHLFPPVVDLQPVEVSGTVKRVGLDHLWVRL